MTTISTPNAATGNLFFEPLLRQFLSYQLLQLNKNVNDPNVTFVDELFGRYGDDVRLEVKTWLAAATNIQVLIGFPREDTTLPFISVVSAEDQEKTSEAYLGDHGGILNLGGREVTSSSQLTTPPNVYGQTQTLPDNRPKATSARYLLSVPEAHTTRLYIATDDVNSTLYLYTIVKALLLVNKMDFDQYGGARNLKMSGADLEHKQDWFPQFAFFKVMTVNYDMNFDVPLSPIGTIGGVNVGLSSMFNGVSVPLTT